MRDIKTIDDLIAEFHGPARFGEWLDIGQEAVSAFKWRGVSRGWHLRLRAELRRRGCDVHPAVFGLTEDEAVGVFDAPKAPATPSSAAFDAAVAEVEAEAKRFNAAMKASEALSALEPCQPDRDCAHGLLPKSSEERESYR